MLRAVVRIQRMGRPQGLVYPQSARLPDGTRHPRAGQKATVSMLLKCGHIAFGREDPYPRMPVQVHCGMCTFLYKEREAKDRKRRAKLMRREKRRIHQLLKVERLMKKKASSKVVKKKDLKKVGKKAKPAKVKKTRSGRKWHMPAELVAAKGSLLARVVEAFKGADDQVVGENDLIAAMEKAGVKPEGKKTVKKLVKGILRNMSRAGVIQKDRERDKDAEKAKSKEDSKKKKDKDEEEDEDDADEDDDAESEEGADESESEDEATEDEEADEDEEEKKPKKKKVLGKKK